MCHQPQLIGLILALNSACATIPCRKPEICVRVAVDPAVRATPVTGRMFLLISPRSGEPRTSMAYTFAYLFNEPEYPFPEVFGIDVVDLFPGESVVFDRDTPGYPLGRMTELPPGEYSVQAVLNTYTRCERSDGHTLWVHLDQGEGQQFHTSPNNLYSRPERRWIDPSEGFKLDALLTEVIPPIPPIPDSEFVRRVRIKSALISEFWGVDCFVNATVLLPKGYDEHEDVRFPVLYYQGHYFEDPPFSFPEKLPQGAREARPLYKEDKAFEQAWLSDDFPRMIIVSFQHPTPFYDDSYFVDSANNGPWGQALMKEVIPAVEEAFRIIPEAYARVLTGGSTGGWVSAALQIYHPGFFGGAWIFSPDPLDFSAFMDLDIYSEVNAFHRSGDVWKAPERFFSRTVTGYPRVSMRDASRLSLVLGSKSRSGEFFDMWNAIYGPVGADGYPIPLWDHESGAIDHKVAAYWRGHGYDLRHYLEQHWSRIGSELVGKLHFFVGEMDDFYLNLAVYRMEAFLEATTDPYYAGSFTYGRPLVGHNTWVGYEDDYPIGLLRDIAEHVARNAPGDSNAWLYD